jgi:hypothetical protein
VDADAGGRAVQGVGRGVRRAGAGAADGAVQGAGGGDQAGGRGGAAAATVGEELAALAARAQLPLPALQECGGIGAEAAALLRGELILGVEKLSQALRVRTKDKKALSSVEELREWNALKRAYERAATLGGLEVRRVMFPDVHLNVCNYAVWLWNDRKEFGISGPLFRWLLAEAEAVGDEEAIALQRKNVGK